MDQHVRVEIQAETLLEALEQVEKAYNDLYRDVPLIVKPIFVRLVLQRWPTDGTTTGKFGMKATGTLREVILTVLDEMRDPAICYSLTSAYDARGRRYFILDLRKDDAPDLHFYADGDEMMQHLQLSERSLQRLETYFDQPIQTEL